MMINVPDLKKLAVLQEELDKSVREKHGIDYDTSNLKIVAFKVEFGEFLNEHKFFKYWKINHNPNVKAVLVPAMFEEDRVYYNPLLEEFADGTHFLLSIGIERKYLKYIHAFDVIDRKSDSLEYLAMEIFSNPINSAGKWLEVFSDYIYFGWLVGITPSDIEEEYLKKNAINHKRQENQY